MLSSSTSLKRKLQEFPSNKQCFPNTAHASAQSLFYTSDKSQKCNEFAKYVYQI